MKRKYDLEERLVMFSSAVIDFVERLPNKMLTKYLGSQLMRSSISPALNYGEAQAAESKKDFVHKMKLCLKELKETKVSLKILSTRPYVDQDRLSEIHKESEELISIFYSSIRTTQKNLLNNENYS
jgi:four helix bundle protein